MRDHLFNSALTRLSALFLLAFMLAGCSEGTPPPSTATATPTPVSAVPPPTPPSSLTLSVSTTWIPTDNATQAAIMATVVDASNAVLPGVYVSFSTSTGNLMSSSAMTDASGQATVYLRSGTDPTNRTATITATVGGQSASTQILIQGSTVTLSLNSSSIQVGAGTVTASATAKNAKGVGALNQSIRFSIGATSTGMGTLSATTLTTDASGVATPLTFTPTVAGIVVLTAEWLNSAGTVTATTTQDITVTGVAAAAFAITFPTNYSTSLSTGATQVLAATVPTTINATAVFNVRITASAGTWVGTTPAAGPATSILQTPSSCVGTSCVVGATYTAPANSGTVSVQVDALDAAGKTLSTLTRLFVISAPPASAYRIFLTTSISTLTPSTATTPSTTTLLATVRDANMNTVGGAAVLFGLLGTTGSGETISPAVAITDDYGVARTTFTAGTVPTLTAIYAQASLVGQLCGGVMPDPKTTETNFLCDAAPLIVTATAVSVSVQLGTKIVEIANSTMYSLPGSVHVVNSNGSPVAGQDVSLSVFPYGYRNGEMKVVTKLSASGTATVPQCGGIYDPSGASVAPTLAEDLNRDGILIPNEDKNNNMILDAGEDLNGNMILDAGEDLNNNGVLSPPSAAGGSVPLKVTTGSDGWANFNLEYAKASAWFIDDELVARVKVGGTESSASMILNLPMSEPDTFDPVCVLSRISSY